MALTTMYAGKINSPATSLTIAALIGDDHIHVSELSVFPTGPNLAVIGTGPDAETILYTAKSAVSGAGTLDTCTRAFEGTAKGWAAGEVVSRAFTAYDYDTVRENINKLNVGTVIKLMPGGGDVPTVNPATFDSTQTTVNGNCYIYGGFNHTSTNIMQWLVEVPSTFEGSELSAVFNWTSTSNDLETVKWQLYGLRVGNTDSLDGVFPLLAAETDINTGNEILNTTTNSASFDITGSGNFIQFSLQRDYTNDTLTHDARILGILIK